MPARGLSLLAIVALVPFAACDLSQKKPETHAREAGAVGAPAAVHEQRFPAGGETGAEAYGAAPAGDEAKGERSIRLHGRGVSRKQQIRV